MVKDQTIRCGDWEAEQLSQEQVFYAPRSHSFVCPFVTLVQDITLKQQEVST
jgi:hypothetical protein